MTTRFSRRGLMGIMAALPAYGVLESADTLFTGMRALGKSGTAPEQEFAPHLLRARAREMAKKPYQAPSRSLPEGLDTLSYDQYRNIRFEAARTLFREDSTPFQAQWLPRGFLFKDKVELNLVTNGKAQRIAFDPSLYRFENGTPVPKPGQDLGYSGFRITAPLNRPDLFDEVAVFQGASYFRAVGKGNVYGTSARGLALNTGDPRGEEFPLFREFWIERPKPTTQPPDTQVMVVHALLDSASACAAFRFSIRPGDPTTTTVEMALYPRVALDQVGIGALTSMFLFGPNDRDGFDDFRPAVHDAQGLAFITASGERCWRPLANPKRLETSVFADGNLRGFGLMQRQRAFDDYQDMEAAYEKRPSTWVEPLGDWGAGAVMLVEIPVQEEIHDNIVAFWRPREPLAKGGEYLYNYRIHWGMRGVDTAPIARAIATRSGGTKEQRLFVIDYAGEALKGVPAGEIKPMVSASSGTVSNVVVQANPNTGGLRVSFNLQPEGAQTVELRAQLMRNEASLAETWLYRWTAP